MFKLFRFYFFVFLRNYKIRNKRWKVDDIGYSSLRALTTVHLSLFFLYNLIILIRYNSFFDLSNSLVYDLILGIILAIVLYLTLVRKGKSEKIYKEFITSPINTKSNRMICWVIWVAIILSLFISAVLIRG